MKIEHFWKITMTVICLFILCSSKAGDFRLTGTNMGSENYIKLQWDTTGLNGNYSYTLYQSDDARVTWQSVSTNYGKKIQVLNVYPDIAGSNGLKAWMETDVIDGKTGAGLSNIDVTLVSITNFNANPDAYLKDGSGKYKCDVIFFGSWNVNNYKDISVAARNAAEAFLKSGRGVLFGHDVPFRYDYPQVHSNFIYLAENYLNMDFSYIGTDGVATAGKMKTLGSTQVKAIKDGFLLQYPWVIPHNSVLTIPFTHSSAQLAKGIVWMNFHNPTGTIVNDLGGTNDFYLSTWNNTAMIQTGHSNGAGTNDEKKIIANTLWYLAQFTVDTTAEVRSAMDKAAPALPSALRASGNNIKIKSYDIGSRYDFFIRASNLETPSIIKYSDTITVFAKSNLKGFYILEDNSPSSVPPHTTLIPATDNAEIQYTITDNSNYVHIQAIDSAGNLSGVYTLPPASYFDDTVWFFGKNAAGDMTSPGIIFEDYTPFDAGRQTKVNSAGTNFSMGVKVCDGYAFYSTYDAVTTKSVMYNWKHEVMKEGYFSAPVNSTDGYAAAYVGNNRYAFFVVSPNKELDYFIVDMGKNGGNGELMFRKRVSDNVSQGIELISKNGTWDQFWLVYYNANTDKIHVENLTGETLTPTHIIAANLAAWGSVNATIMTAGPTRDNFACVVEDGGWGDSQLVIFNINNTTGLPAVRHKHDLSTGLFMNVIGLAYLDDSHCVISSGSASTPVGSYWVFDINTSSSGGPIGIFMGGNVGGGTVTQFGRGGGLKRGPDGIVYQKTDEYVYFLTWDGAGIGLMVSNIPTGDQGTQFSIGLTTPAINPPLRASNQAPVVVNDVVDLYKGSSVYVYPLANDTDPDGDALLLVDVSFVNPLDSLKVKLEIDYENKRINCISKSNEDVSIQLSYTVRDSVVLNSLCSSATIELTVLSPIQANDDHMYVFVCGQGKYPILNNDVVLPGSTVTISAQGKWGTSTIITNDTLLYDHSGVSSCETKFGVDTVKYKLCTASAMCSEANVIVVVMRLPEIILFDSCSTRPLMGLNIQDPQVSYQWQYSADNVSWNDIPYIGHECNSLVEGWYRVKLRHNYSESVTGSKKLVIVKTVVLPGGKTWYEVQFQ